MAEEKTMPCGYGPGDCCAAGTGCNGCGDNPENGPETCAECNGSGEGKFGEKRCPKCKGTGVELTEQELEEADREAGLAEMARERYMEERMGK